MEKPIADIIRQQEETEESLKKLVGNEMTGRILKWIKDRIALKAHRFYKSDILDMIDVNEAHLHRTLERLVRMRFLTKDKIKNCNFYTIMESEWEKWLGKLVFEEERKEVLKKNRI